MFFYGSFKVKNEFFGVLKHRVSLQFHLNQSFLTKVINKTSFKKFYKVKFVMKIN